MAALNANTSLVAGILAGIGASVCCVGPLVLLALGIGGAWIGRSPFFSLACWPCHGSLRCSTERIFPCVDCSSPPRSPRRLASLRQTRTNACQFYYECERCRTLLRPKAGECCVFCSFGSVSCPPIQEQRGCGCDIQTA